MPRQAADANQIHHAFHVVREDLQTHLGAHPWQGLRQKVRVAHPHFYRAERALNGLPTKLHLLGRTF